MPGSDSRTVFRNIIANPKPQYETGGASEAIQIGSACKKAANGNYGLTSAANDAKAPIYIATIQPGSGKTIDDSYAVNEDMSAVRVKPGDQADVIYSGTGNLAAQTNLALDVDAADKGKFKTASTGDIVVARTVEGYTGLTATDNRVWVEFVSVGPTA